MCGFLGRKHGDKQQQGKKKKEEEEKESVVEVSLVQYENKSIKTDDSSCIGSTSGSAFGLPSLHPSLPPSLSHLFYLSLTSAITHLP